jgi:protoporphyrinogen oxidase
VKRDPGRVAIIGAGPCGLGAAFRLRELGHRSFTVFERNDHVGGLAASVRDERGFTWDHGVHVLFSRSAFFNGVMDRVAPPTEWITQRRDAQVWILGRFVPYPLQYNVHRLPDPARRECLLGLARALAAPAGEAATFREWIEAGFGDGLARHFMVPYNEKIWGVPLTEMAVNWIAERVPRPDLARVIANLLDERDDGDWGPNATFRYPRAGGTGAFWRRVADAVGTEHIVLSKAVVEIEHHRREFRLGDGESHAFDTLVSTMPINRLVEMAGLDALRPAARALKSTRVHVVGLGIKGDTPEAMIDRRWIYLPEPGIPAYRVSVPSNFAPSNAPPGHWSLLAEVSETAHGPVDPGRVVADVGAGLEAQGFISSQDIVSRWHRVVEPGYPIPTLGRDRALAELLPRLEDLGIHSRGRFGAWKYEISNQDHSFLQGAELADRLILGTQETTLTTEAVLA